jgi:hypothetical protein
MANPRKKMKQQERFNAIEAENARLLSRMTKIMDAGPRLSVLHRTKVFISNAPTRRNEALQVAKLNQVVLERLNKTGPFYDHKQWAKDRKVTEHILGGMGLYPYVPPAVKKADDFFEKDPLTQKSYESKLDEQWAESLSAFANRSSILDEEFERQNQGHRAASLTPSSLKRPGNDDWMLPGLVRPGIYSHAKEGKIMQVIPDGRLPYQFSARTPSPKLKKATDCLVRTETIPKNVLVAKIAAPDIQVDEDIALHHNALDRSALKSRESRSAIRSRPTSAARPASAGVLRPMSATILSPDATRSNSRPPSAASREISYAAKNHDLNSETNTTSEQGSNVVAESTESRTSFVFNSVPQAPLQIPFQGQEHHPIVDPSENDIVVTQVPIEMVSERSLDALSAASISAEKEGATRGSESENTAEATSTSAVIEADNLVIAQAVSVLAEKGATGGSESENTAEAASTSAAIEADNLVITQAQTEAADAADTHDMPVKQCSTDGPGEQNSTLTDVKDT